MWSDCTLARLSEENGGWVLFLGGGCGCGGDGEREDSLGRFEGDGDTIGTGVEISAVRREG